jgi:hypothetical protein
MAEARARIGYVTSAATCVAAVFEGAVDAPRMLELLKHLNLLQC